jgi:hypothetical protein
MSTLVIFVKPSKTSVKLLRFIDDNVAKINARGAVVKVEKIGDTISEGDCRTKGITRTPAMIDERGRVHVGAEQITKIFRKNIGRGGGGGGGGIEEVSAADVDAFSISRYLQNEMFDRDEDGNLMPKQDDDDSMGDGDDLGRKGAMTNPAQFYSKERGRTGGRQSSRKRGKKPKKAPKRRRDSDSDESDADEQDSDSDDEPRGRRPDEGIISSRHAAEAADDDMDRRMLDALGQKI